MLAIAILVLLAIGNPHMLYMAKVCNCAVGTVTLSDNSFQCDCYY